MVALPGNLMRSFQVHSPFVPADCAAVDCSHYLLGWRTVIDEATELGQSQARYIRAESGRGFVETREAGLTVFTFEAGQKCFAKHKARDQDKPEIFLVRDDTARAHSGADPWLDDFNTNADRVNKDRE